MFVQGFRFRHHIIGLEHKPASDSEMHSEKESIQKGTGLLKREDQPEQQCGFSPLKRFELESLELSSHCL